MLVGSGVLHFGHGCLAGGAQPVNARATGQLGDPGPDRAVVAERGELFEGLREHILEDVLRIGLGKPEAAHANREHEAGEPLDQGIPGLTVAGAAARDELRIRLTRRGLHLT